MDFEERVSRNIRFLRELNSLTQDEFGKLVGKSNQAVSLWESGKSLPRMGIIQQLSDHYHVPTSVIIEGDVKAYLEQKDSPDVKHVFELFNQLPPERKQMVLDMIEVALRSHGLLDK